MERLTSLMKEKFGITRVAPLKINPNDEINIQLRKIASYIYKTGDWTDEDIKEGIKAAVLSNYRLDQQETLDITLTPMTEAEMNQSSHFAEYIKGYRLDIIDTANQKRLTNDTTYYLVDGATNKLKNHNARFYLRNAREVKFYTGYEQYLIGVAKLKKDLIRYYNDNREMFEVYKVSERDYQNQLTRFFNSMNPRDARRFGKQYAPTPEANQYNIIREQILNYISNTYDMIRQQNYEAEIDKMTRATAWMTKKNINDETKSLMENTSLKDFFHYIELDNDVDLELYKGFEKEMQLIYPLLPKSNQAADLRLRKLGNYRALGLFHPATNNIALDFRSGKDRGKDKNNPYAPNEPGIASFIHEYGHFLDYTMNPEESNLSMQDDFRPILHHYQQNLNKLENSDYVKDKSDYYGTPTEVFARAFELYSSHLGLQSSFLRSPKSYQSLSEYQAFGDEILPTLYAYFDKHFPEYRQQIEAYQSQNLERTSMSEATEPKVEDSTSRKVEIDTPKEKKTISTDELVRNPDKHIRVGALSRDDLTEEQIDKLANDVEANIRALTAAFKYRLNRLVHDKNAEVVIEVLKHGYGLDIIEQNFKLSEEEKESAKKQNKVTTDLPSIEKLRVNANLVLNVGYHLEKQYQENIPFVLVALAGQGYKLDELAQHENPMVSKLAKYHQNDLQRLLTGTGTKEEKLELIAKGKYRAYFLNDTDPDIRKALVTTNAGYALDVLKDDKVPEIAQAARQKILENEMYLLPGNIQSLTESKVENATSRKVEDSTSGKVEQKTSETSVRNHMDRKALLEQMNQLDIVEVASRLGMDLVKQGQSYTWSEHDSFVIDTRKNYFYWNAQGIGGNAVKMVQTVKNISFKEALKWLQEQDFTQVKTFQEKPREPFRYYLKETNRPGQGTTYLKDERGISDTTIQLFKSQGALAEGTNHSKDGYSEPVLSFKSYNAQGQLVGATFQGVVFNPDRYPKKGRMKLILPNSDGYRGVKITLGEQPKHFIFAESPIDLMSYLDLHPELYQENVQLISMNGLKEGVVYQSIMDQLNPNYTGKAEDYVKFLDSKMNAEIAREKGFKITLAIDNDAGAQRFIDRFKPKNFPLELDLPPKAANLEKKDWNDVLLETRKQVEVQSSEKSETTEIEGEFTEVTDGKELAKMNEEILNDTRFDEKQKQALREGLENGLDISVYANPSYDSYQMNEIRWGLEKNLDVTQYATTKYNWRQMSQIREGLERNVDIGVYADSKYDDLQMEQIRMGLEDKLDISAYTKPEYNADQMEQIREGLKQGLDVTVYADPRFDFEQMAEIKSGLESGVDVSIYANPQFDHYAMWEILEGLIDKRDVSIFAKPEFNNVQMQEIKLGMLRNVDVTVYAKPEYNYDQMEQIRKGLEQKLDVSIYANPKFDWEQMREIRKGLEENLNASMYANPYFDWQRMSQFREELKYGKSYDTSKVIQKKNEDIDTQPRQEETQEPTKMFTEEETNQICDVVMHTPIALVDSEGELQFVTMGQAMKSHMIEAATGYHPTIYTRYNLPDSHKDLLIEDPDSNFFVFNKKRTGGTFILGLENQKGLFQALGGSSNIHIAYDSIDNNFGLNIDSTTKTFHANTQELVYLDDTYSYYLKDEYFDEEKNRIKDIPMDERDVTYLNELEKNLEANKTLETVMETHKQDVITEIEQNSEYLTKEEVTQLLDEHFQKVEKLLATVNVAAETNHVTTKQIIQQLIQELKALLQSTKQKMTTMVTNKLNKLESNLEAKRIFIKNSVNEQVLKLSDVMKNTASKLDTKFALEVSQTKEQAVDSQKNEAIRTFNVTVNRKENAMEMRLKKAREGDKALKTNQATQMQQEKQDLDEKISKVR
ncbi:LPD1 domain-containing protein [Enterococcus cecorum]|uniref:DUF3991 domain-containing protein n=1 Tax=Enterococcus cecorum TaxID=44008 RepID=A0A200I5B0_9ENTE|nr:LPD1 domain-containing protein [Enterococcus cecorum]OUZ19561.1 hypothetical protein A5869_001215 [Enterococcus cecorum]